MFSGPSRRLALFTAHDDYECYANGYINSFWNIGCKGSLRQMENCSIKPFALTVPQPEVRRKAQIYKIPCGSPGGTHFAI